MPAGPHSILVIEDDRATREMVSQHLQGARYAVLQAENGAMGLRLAGAQPPGLIVLDLALPDTDGLQVLKALKANPALSAVPVIVLSARKAPAEIDAAKKAGAAVYLTKPFVAQTLLDYINGLLRQRPPGRDATTAAARVLLVEPDPVVRTVAASRLRKVGYEALEAPDVAKAVDMARLRPVVAIFFNLDTGGPKAMEDLRQLRVAVGELPIFALSASLSPARTAAAHQAGATDVLPRPLQEATVRTALDRVTQPASGSPTARRKDPRFPCDWAATCLVEDRDLEGRVRNFSSGGLLLQFSEALRKGTSLLLVVEAGAHRFSALGEIVWVDPQGSPAPHGLRFTKLGHDDRSRLNDLLAAAA